MKILITGASGQLGSELKDIKNSEFEYIFTDVNALDITSRTAVSEFFEQNKPDFVVNCAAYTAVDKAEEESQKADLINVRAVKNIVDECIKNTSFLIHISTDYVFDGQGNTPYNESSQVNPVSVYGKTKLAGEKIALNYNRSIVIRTSWLYSKFGNNFVKTMLKLGKEKESLNVVFDQVGTPTNAADLALVINTVISKTANNKQAFIGGLYHYSNEGICSWYDFAHTIMQLGNLNCKVNPIESKDYKTVAKRPHYSVLNKTKIKNTFNIEIPHWRDSLKKLF